MAGKQATVQRAIRAATTTQQFEAENKEALEEVFTRIAAAARSGAVRMPVAKDDFLNRDDVISYMSERGFTFFGGTGYNNRAIEWWSEPKRLE